MFNRREFCAAAAATTASIAFGSRALERLDVVRGHAFREPRLDTDDQVAMRLDCGTQRAHVGTLEIHRIAVRQDPTAADVDQQSALLWRRARHLES